MKQFYSLVMTLTMVLFFSCTTLAEEIIIVGTGSGMEILKAIGDEFTKKNPDIKISVPKSIGSGGGIKSVGADMYIIGRVARGIKEKEKHYNLTQIPIFKMPIVFYINKSVGVSELTPQQICDIYKGKTMDWKDVGGKGGRIKVIRREDGDSSLKVLLDSLPGFKDITITDRSKTTFSDQSTLETAENTKDTIAFGTYGNAVNYNVDILKINGKSASDGDYPYTGTLFLIFKEKNNTGNIKKFIDFAQSPSAHRAIKQTGGLPMK